MRIEQLEYFLAAAQCRSITEAADRLFISQQGLSKALSGLSEELGVELFERSGNRMVLTSSGETLKRHAQDIVKSAQRLRLELDAKSGIKNDYEGLSLYGMPLFTGNIVSSLARQPESAQLLDLPFEEITRSELEGMTALPLENAVVFAVLREHEIAAITEDGPNVFLPLFKTEIVLLSSRKLTSPSKRSISAREAANLPIVYYNEAVLNSIIDDFFGNEKLKSPVRLHTTNTERLMQYLQSGDYATFTDGFSRLLSGDAMEGKVICHLRPETYAYVGAFVEQGLDANTPQMRYCNDLLRRLHAIAPTYMRKNAFTL